MARIKELEEALARQTDEVWTWPGLLPVKWLEATPANVDKTIEAFGECYSVKCPDGVVRILPNEHVEVVRRCLRLGSSVHPGNSCTDCGAGPLLYSARAMAGPVLCHSCAHRRFAVAWGGAPIWAILVRETSRRLHVFGSRPVSGVNAGELVVEGRFLPVDKIGLQVGQGQGDVPAES